MGKCGDRKERYPKVPKTARPVRMCKAPIPDVGLYGHAVNNLHLEENVSKPMPELDSVAIP